MNEKLYITHTVHQLIFFAYKYCNSPWSVYLPSSVSTRFELVVASVNSVSSKVLCRRWESGVACVRNGVASKTAFTLALAEFGISSRKPPPPEVVAAAAACFLLERCSSERLARNWAFFDLPGPVVFFYQKKKRRRRRLKINKHHTAQLCFPSDTDY